MRNGDRVKVIPTSARVPVGPNAGATWIPVEGREVEWSAWWAARLRDGDVVIAAPPIPVPVLPPPQKKDGK